MFRTDNLSVNKAVKILLDLKLGDPEMMEEAVKQAGHFVEDRKYFPEAIPLLMRLLDQEENPKLAEEAAWALWKFREPKAIPILFKKAKNSSNLALRKKAIRALGLLEAPQAIPLLCQLIYDKSYIIRATAISALGYFKEPKVIAVLEGTMNDVSSAVRKEALAALGRFLRRDPKNQTPALVKKIIYFASRKHEKDPSVRLEALTTLSYMGEKLIRTRLSKAAFEDPAAFIREGALSLLQHWEDAQSEASLIEGLQDRDWSVRFAAANLLIEKVSQKIVFNRISVLLSLHKIAHTFPKTNPAKQSAADLINSFSSLG